MHILVHMRVANNYHLWEGAVEIDAAKKSNFQSVSL